MRIDGGLVGHFFINDHRQGPLRFAAKFNYEAPLTFLVW
jgi:hypothetical protein